MTKNTDGILKQRAALYTIGILSLLILRVEPYPEQGKWSVTLSERSNAVTIGKSLYKNSTAVVKEIDCKSQDSIISIKVASLMIDCPIKYLGMHYENSSAGNGISCRDAAGLKVPVLSDGVLVVSIEAISSKPFNISVEFEMKSSYGYLSAIDWPLLPFYSVMCVVYVVYGFFWMVICFCYWRDLLRIQLWIGAVIFLGLIEKAVFVAEYESINESGKSVQGAVIAAELVSCLKRTLSRMLVIIVSLGFGITKPRLGVALHKVTALGCVYFVLSSAEAIIRVVTHKADSSVSILIAIVPLAMTDSLICWWIFSSLVQTIRSLILKKNLVKLSLYRHFRNTMILAVLASIVFMFWSFKNHRMANCVTDWKGLWFDDAYWHVLFSSILLVIIILWRPSANNQRYAYSPLHDVDEGEEDDLVYEAVGDVKKVRGTKNRPNNNSAVNEDEHLKWVDENIPTSILDIELPGLLESDSELNQHNVQVSKML